MYNLNYSEILKSYPDIEIGDFAEITPCTDGWMYDKNIYKNTVVTEVSH